MGPGTVGFTCLLVAVASAYIPSQPGICTLTECDSLGITTELGPKLSARAAITLPCDAAFEPFLVRASTPRIKPSFRAVVEVGTEKDVRLTIEFARRHDVPFLAVSGGHGWPDSLNSERCGIQINMRKMKNIVVNADGKSATVEGGILQYEMVSALADRNKQTVGGLCECVSAAGPLLGGGHGALQGRYGLASDNLISARIVLGDGEVKVASRHSNPDLFWAVKGAGHNFGIVTSFDIKVYDIPPSNQWTIFDFVFTQDKLEAVLAVADTFLESEANHPVELLVWGVWVRIPDVDPKKPVILYSVSYEGSIDQAEPFAKKFRDLGPVQSNNRTGIAYRDLSRERGEGIDSVNCASNLNYVVSSNSIQRLNVTAMRKAFEVFSEATEDPAFAPSAYLLEGYGRQGVKAVDERSSAVPPDERAQNMLMSALFRWTSPDQTLQSKAIEAGKSMKQIVIEGTNNAPYHVYVNYATGKESSREIYGYDDWRLQRLRRTKEKWDPTNQFRFYVPIK